MWKITLISLAAMTLPTLAHGVEVSTAKIEIYLPSGEVKHFEFTDSGQNAAPIECGLKGYDCLAGFAQGKLAKQFQITCKEKNRAPMFGSWVICGHGFMPTGLHFGRKLEYGIAFHCD